MQQKLETFFTAIGCMDGRIQETVAEFGKTKFGVDYADTITEAGFIGVLARHAEDQAFMDGFSQKVFISVSEHQSKGIVVHAHENCAGNPIDNDHQREQVRGAVELISFFVTPTPVTGVFIFRSETNPMVWIAEELTP